MAKGKLLIKGPVFMYVEVLLSVIQLPTGRGEGMNIFAIQGCKISISL